MSNLEKYIDTGVNIVVSLMVLSIGIFGIYLLFLGHWGKIIYVSLCIGACALTFTLLCLLVGWLASKFEDTYL